MTRVANCGQTGAAFLPLLLTHKRKLGPYGEEAKQNSTTSHSGSKMRSLEALAEPLGGLSGWHKDLLPFVAF